VSEEALAHWGLSRQKQNKLTEFNILLLQNKISFFFLAFYFFSSLLTELVGEFAMLPELTEAEDRVSHH